MKDEGKNCWHVIVAKTTDSQHGSAEDTEKAGKSRQGMDDFNRLAGRLDVPWLWLRPNNEPTVGGTSQLQTSNGP
jgi:hypothetical protein